MDFAVTATLERVAAQPARNFRVEAVVKLDI